MATYFEFKLHDVSENVHGGVEYSIHGVVEWYIMAKPNLIIDDQVSFF